MNKDFGYFHIDDRDIFTTEVTVIPAKRYMVISIANNLVNDLPESIKEYDPFDVGMNIFYIYNFETFYYRKIDFDLCDCYKLVFRLLGKDKDGRIYFRLLKCNESDNIDFKEELEQVSSLVMQM